MNQPKEIPVSKPAYIALENILKKAGYGTLKPSHVAQFNDGTMAVILYGKIGIELSYRGNEFGVHLLQAVVVNDFEFPFSSVRDAVIACRLAITFAAKDNDKIEESEM